MTSESLTKKLSILGLSEDEAEIYIQLLTMGPTTAGVLSKNLKINRMKTYRRLQNLEKRGILEKTLSRPVKYVALPLDEILERFVSEEKNRLDSFERITEEIKSDWEDIRKDIEVRGSEPRFRILQGRRQVFEQINTLCERAQNEIFIVTTQNDLFRLSYFDVIDVLERRGQEDVEVNILTQIQHLDPEFTEYLGVAEVRHTVLPSVMRFVIADEREAITTFAMDDTMSMTTKEDIGLWIEAPDYVKATSTSLKALWRDSIDADEMISALEDREKQIAALESVKKAFVEEGWIVEVPGKIAAEDSTEHSFSIVARRQREEENVVLIDQVQRSDELLNKVVLLYAKSSGIGHHLKIILSEESFDNQTMALAKLFDVQLVNSQDLKKLIEL